MIWGILGTYLVVAVCLWWGIDYARERWDTIHRMLYSEEELVVLGIIFWPITPLIGGICWLVFRFQDVSRWMSNQGKIHRHQATMRQHQTNNTHQQGKS